jgi:2-keto-3-deoxy-L-rhamnonate aldolase RhmA
MCCCLSVSLNRRNEALKVLPPKNDGGPIEVNALRYFRLCRHPGTPRRRQSPEHRVPSAGLYRRRARSLRSRARSAQCDIRRALEAGAEGIFLPEIRSIDDINAAASAAFFPPKGDRGICPSVRAVNFNFRIFNQYADWNNREINLIPMIENPQGVELIDDICSHPDVHVVIFGQGDLAFSLGEGTEMAAGRQTAEAYRKILASAKKHNVAVMGGPVLTPNADECRRALEDGVRVFCLGLDSMAFRSWCEATVRALADGSGGRANGGARRCGKAGFRWTRLDGPVSCNQSTTERENDRAADQASCHRYQTRQNVRRHLQ